MKQTILQTTLLLIVFNINAGIKGEIRISTEKLNTLKDQEVGIVKSMIKKSTVEDKTRYIEQKYFSGLLYLFDPRSFEEIVDQKGFHPKIERGINNPISADELRASYSGLSPTLYLDKNIIITTTHFNSDTVSGWKEIDHHYMIDTNAGKIFGLDLKKTENRSNDSHCNEIYIEGSIPLCCIIGYFKRDDPNTFYKNEKYTGHFSWDVINIVSNYKKLSFPTRKQRLFNNLHRLCYP